MARSSTASGAWVVMGARSTSGSCARWCPARRRWERGSTSSRRSTHHPRRAPAAPALPRRAADLVNVLAGEMAIVGPPDRAGAGRSLYGPAAPPRRSSRASPAGRRWPDVAAMARANRARRLVRRSPLDAARPAHPRAYRPPAGERPRPLLGHARAGLVSGMAAGAPSASRATVLIDTRASRPEALPGPKAPGAPP